MKKDVFSNINYVRPLIREYFQPAAILIRLYFNDGRVFYSLTQTLLMRAVNREAIDINIFLSVTLNEFSSHRKKLEMKIYSQPFFK